MGNSSKKRLLGALLGLVMVPAACIAQARDPFAMDPADRPSASLPLPYGLIVTGALPLYSYDVANDQKLSTRFRYGVAAYVDAWQFGFERKIYGDVFQLAFRTVGRDVFSGALAEYGTDNVVEQRVYLGPNGEEIHNDTTRIATFYGVGYRYGSSYKAGISMIYRMDVALGLWTLDGAISPLYSLNVAGGGRIPIGTTALSIMAFGEYVEATGATAFSIGLMSTLALNLQVD